MYENTPASSRIYYAGLSLPIFQVSQYRLTTVADWAALPSPADIQSRMKYIKKAVIPPLRILLHVAVIAHPTTFSRELT